MTRKTKSQSNQRSSAAGGRNRGGAQAKRTSTRGFASLSADQRREISSRGGRASHGGRGADYVKPESRGSSPSSGFRRGPELDRPRGDDQSQPRQSGGANERYSASGNSSWRNEGSDERSGRGQPTQRDDGRYSNQERQGGGNRGRENFNDSRGSGQFDRNQQGNGGRGFASMDPDRRREISSHGGQASHGHRDWQNQQGGRDQRDGNYERYSGNDSRYSSQGERREPPDDYQSDYSRGDFENDGSSSRGYGRGGEGNSFPGGNEYQSDRNRGEEDSYQSGRSFGDSGQRRYDEGSSQREYSGRGPRGNSSANSGQRGETASRGRQAGRRNG